MKRLFLFLLAVFTLSGYAQEIGLPARLLVKNRTATETYVGTDAFGWEYTIADNEFRKSKEGRILKYKTLSLGDIYKADIQNPLQIVLFYRKFNAVVLLDNQLNETSRILFSDLNEPVVAEAVSLASQNRLWVYDVNRQQIGLYDIAKATFRTITSPFSDPLKYYQSDYNYFYWIDTKNNCYSLNLFGKVQQLGKVPEYTQVQLAPPGNAIIYNNEGLFVFSFTDNTLKPVVPVDKSFRGFHYAAQILSIFTENEITQYKVTLP